MGDEYNEIYGYCAVVSNGKVIGINDLYSDFKPKGLTTLAKCADCDCPMDYDDKIDIFKCNQCGQQITFGEIADFMQDENNEMEDYEDYY